VGSANDIPLLDHPDGARQNENRAGSGFNVHLKEK
jgi:hypothetical protein